MNFVSLNNEILICHFKKNLGRIWALNLILSIRTLDWAFQETDLK